MPQLHGRIWKYLRANEQTQTPRHLIFVDTETDDVPLSKGRTGFKLRFGWACYTRPSKTGGWTAPEWKRFTDKDDFWLWVMHHCKTKQKLWIWCHNSNFDYPVLDGFATLSELGWEVKSAIIDGPPTIVRYRKGNMTLVMCDTLNIWRMPLAKLGKKVGIEKMEMPAKWGDLAEDDAYCQRDVMIIMHALTGWIDLLKREDLGGFRPTIAAQSMQVFRHRYMHDRILIDAHEEALKIARAAYHGGRCECAYIGELKQPVHYVDINSMYPYVMSYAELPLRLIHKMRVETVGRLSKLLQEFCLCTRVRLKTDDAFAPLVMDGKLCFPTGEFCTWLSTPEIEYALKIGAIEEVYEVACYEKGVPFREFALDLYSRKESAVREGNTVEAEHWKLLLNSFSGKWGQSGKHWVKIGICNPRRYEVWPDIHMQTGEKTRTRYFGGVVSQMCNDAESLESHPAIIAHITAHARMILHALIKQIPPGDYFYCDTDGLLVGDKGLDVLRDRLDDFKLGGIKHVESYSHVFVYGCKDLVKDGKRTLKGIRDNAECVDERTYRQVKWVGLKRLAALHSLDMPFTVPVLKTLSRTYTKGTVLPSGFVAPLHLGGSK